MASRRQRRREVDWDYKKLGSTGERVLKPRNILDNYRMSLNGDEPTGKLDEAVMKPNTETVRGAAENDNNEVGNSVGDTLKNLR